MFLGCLTLMPTNTDFLVFKGYFEIFVQGIKMIPLKLSGDMLVFCVKTHKSEEMN